MVDSVNTILVSNLEKIQTIYNDALQELFLGSLQNLSQMNLEFPLDSVKMHFLLRKLMYLDNMVSRQMNLLQQTQLLIANTKLNIMEEFNMEFMANYHHRRARKKSKKQEAHQDLPLLDKPNPLLIALRQAGIES